MIRPATNAPSVNESPAWFVSHATTMQIPAIVMKKSSRLFCRATRYRSPGMTQRARMMTTSRIPATFAIPRGSASRSGPLLPMKIGVMRSIGMMARSWKIRIPNSVRPCRVSTSRRSCRIFITIAVLESDMMNPKTTAARERDAEGIRDERDGNNRCAELDEAADDDDPPRFEEFVERELEPDREEQEHDPDLTNGLDR